MKYIPLLLLVLGGSACAETTDVLIQQLTAAVRTELNDPKSPLAGDRDKQYKILADIGQIKVNYADGKPRRGCGDYLLSSVEEMGAVSQSHMIQELCQTLGKQLRRELAERQVAAVEKIKTETSTAIRKALAAKSTRDFDDPLAVMTRTFSDGEIINSKDPAHVEMVGQVHHVRQFLLDLQDYLANLGLETSVISENRWRNLIAPRDDFFMFVPRSEILAGLQEFRERNGVPEGRKPTTQEDFEKKGWQIVEETKSLDDLNQTNTKLAELMLADEVVGLRKEALSRPVGTLREYARIYAEVKSGTVSHAEISSLVMHQTETPNSAILNLNKQLVLAALPTLLQVAETPKADEVSAAFVQRITDQAAAAGDWTLLARAIDVTQIIRPNSTTPLADRLTVHSFLVGLNQERAHQYELAVGSFQKALKAGSTLISAEIISRRLDAIHKEHPQEFEQGMKAAPASGGPSSFSLSVGESRRDIPLPSSGK